MRTPRLRHVRNMRFHRIRRAENLLAWLGAQAVRIGTTAEGVFNMLKGGLLPDEVEGAPVKPVATVAPAITGTAQVGQVLTCSNGTWTGSPTLTRQWQKGTANIAGATAATYTPVAGDVGSTIRCVVTARNVSGSTTSTTAATSAVIAA